jgi:PST family polysaccharide transporter
LFKDLGLSTATVQWREITHEQVNGLFWINVGLGFIVMGALAALSPAIAWFYGRPELLLVTIGFAAMAPISSFGAQHSALLKRQMKFTSLAIRDLAALTLGIVAGITAAWFGARYWALVIMQAVSATVAVIAVWLGSGWRPSRPKVGKEVRPLLRFGAHLSAANCLSYMAQNLDSVLLGYFFGPASLGIYNRAQHLLRVPLRQMMSPVMSVATPALCRLASDGQRFSRAVCQLLRNTALFSTLLVTILMPLSDWVVRVLLGPGWEESARIFAVLALFGFIQPAASVLATSLVAWGKPESLFRWRMFAVPLTIAGILGGLPWGPMGIAVAFAASSLLIRVPLLLWYVSRNTPLAFFDALKSIAPFVVIGAAVCSTLFLVRLAVPFSSLYTGLAACVIIGLVLYVSALMTVPFGRETVASVLKLALPQYLLAAKTISRMRGGPSSP